MCGIKYLNEERKKEKNDYERIYSYVVVAKWVSEYEATIYTRKLPRIPNDVVLFFSVKKPNNNKLFLHFSAKKKKIILLLLLLLDSVLFRI